MAKALKVNGDTFNIMLSERRIKTRVRALARTISKDYRERSPSLSGS